MANALKIQPTWLEVGSYSRFDTWVFSQNQIDHWLKQKGYNDYKKKFGTANLCKKFGIANGFSGSNTDVIILAYQNFKEFREFVNNLKTI